MLHAKLVTIKVDLSLYNNVSIVNLLQLLVRQNCSTWRACMHNRYIAHIQAIKVHDQGHNGASLGTTLLAAFRIPLEHCSLQFVNNQLAKVHISHRIKIHVFNHGSYPGQQSCRAGAKQTLEHNEKENLHRHIHLRRVVNQVAEKVKQVLHVYAASSVKTKLVLQSSQRIIMAAFGRTRSSAGTHRE